MVFTSNWLLQDLSSSNPLKGIVPRRPKNEKYKKMILGLATAIEKHPYSLTRASKYLREWVEEKLVLVAPLQVDIIQHVNPDFRGRQRPVTSFGVVGLEPAVSAITVHAAPPGAATTPKMTVIFGIASSLKNMNGLNWANAFTQAYELWDKLHFGLASSLTIPEGNVPIQDLYPAQGPRNDDDGVEPPPEEDDLSVPLDVLDRSEF